MISVEELNNVLEFNVKEKGCYKLDHLLKAGADPVVHGSLLPHCLINNNLYAAKTLLEHGADINSTDDKGNSVLMTYVDSDYSNSDAVRDVILANGANVNYQNPQTGQTALHIASIHRNGHIIQIILNAGALTDVKDNKGKLPIDYLKENCTHATMEQFKTIKLLGTPDESDIHRNTLQEAAVSNDIETIKKHVKHKDQLNEEIFPNPGTSLMSLAIQNGHIEIVRYLLKFQDLSAYHVQMALYTRNKDILKLFLEHGMDPNINIGEHAGPLNLLADSSKENALECMKMLVKAGTDVNKHNPINIAAVVGNLEGFKLLVQAGANYEPRFFQPGKSPLEQAMYSPNITNCLVNYILQNCVSNKRKRPATTTLAKPKPKPKPNK